MSLLNVTALHKYYGDNHVLKGIDLKVEEGEVVAAARARAPSCARSMAWSRSTTA